MKKLYLYTVFHGSLQYSAIPEKDYEGILDKDFWQILRMSSDIGVKLGFELTSWTLRLLQELDPVFVKELKGAWHKNRCEIIGSSYSQTIFPLVPAKVNKYGLEIAIKDYRYILGRVPEIVFVNEQTYSSGLPKLYKDAGYKAIVMEWEKSALSNNYPEILFYSSPVLAGADGTKVRLLWSSTTANRWFFDEYAKGRRSLKEYAEYLKSHYSPTEDRCFPLYCGDWEIFDYMPFDFGSLGGECEIARLRELFEYLVRQDWVEFMLPSDIIKKFAVDRKVKLTTAGCPVLSGGPETYSAGRWAVSGVDDVTLNTQCHQIFERLEMIENLCNCYKFKITPMIDKWQLLNFLWGSNLKTQVTAEKLIDSRNKIGVLLDDTTKILKSFNERTNVKGDFGLMNISEYDWEGGVHVIPLKFMPGRFKENLLVKSGKTVIPSQLEDVRRYSDGSVRSANLVVAPEFIKKGKMIECRLYEADRNNAPEKFKFSNNLFESEEVLIKFDPQAGGRIKELSFPGIYKKPIAGTFYQGFYEHGTADFIIKPDVNSIVTDNQPCRIEMDKDAEDYSVRIPFQCHIALGIGALWKKYFVHLNEPRVDVIYRFYLKNIRPLFFRIGGLTVNPSVFKRNKLKYVTINGGYAQEEFALAGKTVKQDELVGVQNEWSSTALTTIPHCIGATEGWLDINDGEKGISIVTDKSLCYSVFLLHYEEKGNKYFLKTTASVGEHDSTGAGFWKGYYDFTISYIGHKGGCPKYGAKAGGINQKLVTMVQKQKWLKNVESIRRH